MALHMINFMMHILSIRAPVECSHVDTTGGMSEFT